MILLGITVSNLHIQPATTRIQFAEKLYSAQISPHNSFFVFNIKHNYT